MSARRPSRHHAIVLVPATMLSMVASAPWGGAAAPTARPIEVPAPLPEPAVSTQSLEAPASVADRGVVARHARQGIDRAIAGASTSGIPLAALAAYQRAETVINAADKSCNLTWQLIAAVGRVESDHGRYGGNRLDAEGVARPGIFGIPLDGTNDTAVIRDTDAGQYDDDDRWDRAVGPMQFIPSTWSVVGVDGDADGTRDPQDIDDAALATAVYLCSGNDDLSREVDQRSAIYRYNHSHHYVSLVLSLMEAYLEGDYDQVPDTASFSGTFVPSRSAVGSVGRTTTVRGRSDGGRQQEIVEELDHELTGSNGGGRGPLGSELVPVPEEPATEEPATEEPDDGLPVDDGTEEPVAEPGTEEPPVDDDATTEPTPTPTPEPTPEPDVVAPTEEELAVQQCLAEAGAAPETDPLTLTPEQLAIYQPCMAALGFPQ